MFGIAFLCLDWYRISSFEGGSGYFMIGMSILGIIVGFILSVIAARVAYAKLNTEQTGAKWSTQIAAVLIAITSLLTLVIALAFFRSFYVT